jgi:hypothetical protein
MPRRLGIPQRSEEIVASFGPLIRMRRTERPRDARQEAMGGATGSLAGPGLRSGV